MGLIRTGIGAVALALAAAAIVVTAASAADQGGSVDLAAAGRTNQYASIAADEKRPASFCQCGYMNVTGAPSCF